MSDQEKELTTAILVFAHYLGIDLDHEPELVHIAEEAFDKLPPDWEFGIGEDEHAGIPYFYNTVTDQSDWKHPEEEKYLNKVKKERKAIQERKAQKNKRNESSGGNNNNNKNSSGFSEPRGNDSSSNGSKRNEDTVEVMDFEDDESPVKSSNANAKKGNTLNNPTAAPASTTQKQSQATSYGMSADDFLDDEPADSKGATSGGTSGSKITTADNSPPLFKEKSTNDRPGDSRSNQNTAGSVNSSSNRGTDYNRDRDNNNRDASNAQSDGSSRGRDTGIGSNQSRSGSLLYSSQSPERGRQNSSGGNAGGGNRRDEGSPVNYRVNKQFSQSQNQQQQNPSQGQQGNRNNVTFRDNNSRDSGDSYRGGGGGGSSRGGGAAGGNDSRSDSRERGGGRDTSNGRGATAAAGGGGGGGQGGGYNRQDDYNRGRSSSGGNYSNNSGGGGGANSDRYQTNTRAASTNSGTVSNTGSAAAAAATLSAEMEAHFQQQIQRLQDAREEAENKMSSMQKKHQLEITSHLDNIRRLESKVLDEKHEQHTLQDKISALQMEHSAKLRDVEESYELKLREAARKAKLEADEDWKEKQRVNERKHGEELEALRAESITLKRRLDDATREVENMKRKVTNSKVDGMLEAQGEADSVRASLRELEEAHRVQTIELRKAREENVTLNSRLISAIQASQIAVAESEAAKNISANAVHESSSNSNALMQATHRIMQLDSDLAVAKAENTILHKEKETISAELRKLQGTIGFHGDKLSASESEARRIKANSQAEIARLTSKTVELDALVNVLRTQLDNATDNEVASVREVRRELEKSECEVLRLRDRLNDAEVREDSLNARIKSLEKELLKQQEVTFKKERLMKDETQKIDVLTNRISEMRFEHEREVEKLKSQLAEHQRVHAELQQRHKQELDRVQAEEAAKLPLLVQSAVEKIEYGWGKKFSQEVADLEANYEKVLEKQKREIFELKRASIEKESEMKLAQTEERVELERLRSTQRHSRHQVEELEQTIDDLKRELRQELRSSRQLRNHNSLNQSHNRSHSRLGRSQMRDSRSDWQHQDEEEGEGEYFEDSEYQLAQLRQQRSSWNNDRGWRSADQDEVMRGMDENDRNLMNSREYSSRGGGGNYSRNQRDFQEQNNNSFDSQAVSLINTQLSLMKQQMSSINSGGTPAAAAAGGGGGSSAVKKTLRLPQDHLQHQHHQRQQAFTNRMNAARSGDDYQHLDDVSVDNHNDVSYVEQQQLRQQQQSSDRGGGVGDLQLDSEMTSEAGEGMVDTESHPVVPTSSSSSSSSSSAAAAAAAAAAASQYSHRPPLHSSGKPPLLHAAHPQHVKFTSDSPSSRLFSTPTSSGDVRRNQGGYSNTNSGVDHLHRPHSLSAHMALVDDNISLISQSLLDESSVLNSSRVAPDSAHFIYQPNSGGRSSGTPGTGGMTSGRYLERDFDAQPSAILNTSSDNYLQMDYSRMSAASFHKYSHLHPLQQQSPSVNGRALHEEVDALLQATGSSNQFDSISDGGYYEGYWKAKYSGSGVGGKNSDQ